MSIKNSLMTDGATMSELRLDYVEADISTKRAAWLRHEDWIQANDKAKALKQ
jgi:hypothetical protein